MTAGIPPFTVFPSAVWADRDLCESDLRVLGVLCAHFNRKTGQCNPSQQRIADETGYNRNTVKAALRRLKRWGYIDWITPRRADGGNGVNQYRIPIAATEYGHPLAIPDWPTPRPPQTSQGQASGTDTGMASPGWPGPGQSRVARNIEVEQRRGTENSNTAARIRETALTKPSKDRSPADDPLEVIPDAS